MNDSFLQTPAKEPSVQARDSASWGKGGCVGVGILVALLLALLPAGCNQAQPTAQEKKAIEVIATWPITSEVADYQDFTGRLDAVKTVDIRARVSGFVVTAPFKEGDLVHEGDLLFQIDERTYRATYNQAEANLKQSAADRNLQEQNSRRARRMADSRSLSQEDYDTVVATLEKSKATVGAMEAARDMAKLYLDFTKVIAPLTGHISRRLADPGNLIVADNTILTTIVADSSLYAYFDVDERTYLDLVAAASPGQNPLLTGQPLPVVLRLVNEEEFTHKGSVDFIDNRVNAATGTIRMRGIFDNAAGILKPGLFVRIRLPIGKPYQAILTSSEAILSDQGRKYVYIVNDNNEVVYRPVTVGQESHGLSIIKKGLSTGERVIISGMQRVRQGAQVQVKLQEPPKAPPSVLVQMLEPSPNVQAAKQGDTQTGRQGEAKTKKDGSGTVPGGG